ncbi:proton channel OTOP3-like [Narcine bancroftii]|uniref:proton channel OTOP3-like n=1 Tax=Narcine bancroftii TaxID=1343680 RepID=UPI00383171B4
MYRAFSASMAALYIGQSRITAYPFVPTLEMSANLGSSSVWKTFSVAFRSPNRALVSSFIPALDVNQHHVEACLGLLINKAFDCLLRVCEWPLIALQGERDAWSRRTMDITEQEADVASSSPSRTERWAREDGRQLAGVAVPRWGRREGQQPAGTVVQGQHEEVAAKRSRLLSALLAINILFLGAALDLSSIFNQAAVSGTSVLILLMVLSALSVGWMLCHQVVGGLVPHRDHHAGPIWLRGAVLLFGACTLLLDIFKMGYYIEYRHGACMIKVIYPIVEAVFIGTQTYFLWFHSRDCPHVHQHATRCGLMVTLATNLVMWMTRVTDDSIHSELEAEKEATYNGSTSDLGGHANLSDFACPTELCSIFRKGVVIMFPFNIEYCLISSTLLYIMWANTGRRAAPHHPAPASWRYRGHGLVWGPLLGCLALVVGLLVFALYQLQVSARPVQTAAFVQFYAFHVALLSAMCLCSSVGLAVHRWEERGLDRRENPSRSLDVVLLQMAALGQLGISYFSIVALASSRPEHSVDRLNLASSLLLIAEHALQNLFIIEGLSRPGAAQELGAPSAGAAEKEAIGLQEKDPLPSAAAPGPRPADDPSAEPTRRLSRRHQLNWKRRLMKEVSVFLILSNLVLWIMPAFGAQPQFENGLEKQFYGFSVWFAIVNFGLPLGVFYRMHSAGNLLEIYLSA